MKRLLFTALVMALLYTPLAASALQKADSVKELTGKVINPDGNPVAGAHIHVNETGAKVFTDSSGRFKVLLPVNAVISLTAHTSRYVDVSSSSIDLSAYSGETVTLQFERERDFGETIVITGTRQETMLRDTPVRTEVITSELIEQKQAVNLADAIDGLSGLRVENNCQNCGFNQLRINGLEGGYSRITVDGMNAFSSMTGVYGLEQIPSIIVDRVEVVKGGGSVLYGAGAVGGVVNVITRQPVDTSASLQTSLASRDGEFAGLARGYGSWAGPDGGMSLFVFGSIDKANEYDRNGDGLSDLGRKQLESGGGKLFLTTLNDSAELQIGFDASHEWRRGGANIDLLPENTELTEFTDTLRRTLNSNWVHSLGADTYYQIQFAHSWNERESYYGSRFDPNAYGSTTNPHTTITATGNHIAASNSLTFGLQYEGDKIDDYHPGYNFRIEQEYENYGVFLQNEYAVSSGFTVLAGLRLDDHSALSDPVFSPRLSLMWALNEEIRLRASYAYGFRAPVVFDEDLHITIAGGEPTFIRNVDSLREEAVNSYSLSLQFTNRFSGGISLRLETNAFHSRLEDTFVLEEIEAAGARFLMRRNGGGSSVSGFEFTGDLSFSRLTLNGSLTLQRSELEEPEPDFGATRYFKAPDVYGSLNAVYAAPGWTLGASYTYTGSMLVPHYAGFIAEDRLENTSDFHIIDLRLEFKLGRMAGLPLSTVLSARNITDDYQQDFDRGLDRDAGYVYGPRTPRTLSLALKLDF